MFVCLSVCLRRTDPESGLAIRIIIGDLAAPLQDGI